MTNERLRVKRLHPDAQLPTRAHDLDAGFDIHALEKGDLAPGHIARIRTGIAIGVPAGQVGDIRPRSGMAASGITVANSPGTVDPGYNGELIVMLINHGRNHLLWEAGDRIAQLVLTYTNTAPLIEVDELGDSARGAGGFGSTGH